LTRRHVAIESTKLNSGLDVLDPEECLRLVLTQTVGRLGIIVDGRPEFHPVNFALAGEHVIIRSDHDTKLAAALAGPVVFEVDHFEEATTTRWSVMMHGRAQLVSGRADQTGPQNRVLHPWPQAELPQQLRIIAVKVTGRGISTPRPHRWPPAGTGPLMSPVLDKDSR
jgi:hypothetical protein